MLSKREKPSEADFDMPFAMKGTMTNWNIP
jgi:hypothetical protein